MLDMKRRDFIALVGGGGLLLASKVKRRWPMDLVSRPNKRPRRGRGQIPPLNF